MVAEQTEEEKMMEAWAADSGATDSGTAESVTAEEGAENQADAAENAAFTGGSAKVLSQNEIDSLLGFGDAESGQETSGIMALINSALVNYERLPMLEIVFDRLVRMLSTNLRNFTSDNVDVSIDHITSVRFGDYLNSIPLPAMLCVFRAEEWDNSGLMTIDSSLIYSIVDVLLGGRKGTAQMRVEGRPYTTIERNLVGRLAKVVLADMSSAFDPLSPVTFKFDRLETNPRFATIARPANAAVLVKLRIDMEERGGKIEILIPYATLEPIRELLLQMFMGEKFGRDSIWEAHLSNELLLTDVKINAVLDKVTISLHDVMNWRPGSKLVLNVKADDAVSLCSGDVPLFKGKIGSLSDRVAVRVEDVLIKHGSEIRGG